MLSHGRKSFLVRLLLLVLLTAIPGLAIPQNDESVPDNASASKYSKGWECNQGYRPIGESHCAPVKIPAHAYATNASYGDGWECGRGYERADNHCVVISLPENAYLNNEGNGWKCERGSIKKMILQSKQQPCKQACKRGKERDPHAVAHVRQHVLYRGDVCILDNCNRTQHDDKTDYCTQQTKLDHHICYQPAQIMVSGNLLLHVCQHYMATGSAVIAFIAHQLLVKLVL